MREMKLLAWLFVFGTVVESFNFIEFSQHRNNLWIVNIYTLLEGVVYFNLCARWMYSPRLFRLGMQLFIIYVLYWIFTTFISGSFLQFNSNEKVLKGIFLIGLSGYALIHLSREDAIMLTEDYRFWILSGILIYFSITEVVFATSNFILDKNEPALRTIWAIHSVINILSNLLFAIGFVCNYRRPSFFTW